MQDPLDTPVGTEVQEGGGDGVEAGKRRGMLKVYLGATPGSGKTFAMLMEGRERLSNGEDVVVGFVETHGRHRTADAIGHLETVPRLRVEYRGTVLEEMDVAAVVRRHPAVVLIDELAHTNAPGLAHTKRWQDIEEVRDAGIDVITTLNIQHLESVRDVVERVTGVPVRETVPDQVLDRADDIRFIDITPEALRKRMRHGNVYPRERIDSALANFFTPSNLAALREIALQMIGDRLGQATVEQPPGHVLVAVSGTEGSIALVRRAVRLARRSRGHCTVLCVHTDAQGGQEEKGWQGVAVGLECTVEEESSPDVAAAVIAAARRLGVSHVVVGEQKSRTINPFRKGVVEKLVAGLDDCNIHVIARHTRRHLHPGTAVRPTAEDLLHRLEEPSSKGRLRLYLSYVHNSGATTMMLAEAARRRGRGSHVMLAAAGQLDTHEIPPGLVSPGGVYAASPVDIAAILAYNPDVCCVDNLSAYTSDGRPLAEALPELLSAGITVLGTICLTDLESMQPTLESLAPEFVSSLPVADAVIEAADEVELVDIPPEDLLLRLREDGTVVDGPLDSSASSPYSLPVLQTLRELAFRHMAAYNDRQMVAYMRQLGDNPHWETRPRILVCIAPNPGGAELLRAAAARAALHGDALTALSVRSRQHDEAEKRLLGEYAALAHKLGAEFVTLYQRDVARAIVDYANEHYITEVMVRRSERKPRVVARLIEELTDVDVHIFPIAG